MKLYPSHFDQCPEVLRTVFGDRPLKGVEIGTGAGSLTQAILRQVPTVEKLWTIDPWRFIKGARFEAGSSQDRLDADMREAHERLDQYGARCQIMRMQSAEALRRLRRDEVWPDFVWIDGDHCYETVRADIEASLSLLGAGCLLGGHDYGQVADVKRAVDEAAERINRPLETGGDFTWWFRL